MPTKDKLYISVDLFARWRITDPLQYFLRLRDERSAQSRLDDILGSETRNAVAKAMIAEDTTLVLSTDSDLFKFLKGMDPDGKPGAAGEPETGGGIARRQ